MHAAGGLRSCAATSAQEPLTHGGLSAQQSKSKFGSKRFEAIDCVIESTVCCGFFQLASGNDLKTGERP
jgi:hypothetical protein